MKRFLLAMRARFLLAMVLALPLLGISQAFNGNFETLQPSGIPTGWSIEDAGGAAVSTDAHLGKRAIKAWIFKNYESGTWVSRSGTEDGNASEVSGYYKYLGDKKECDKASVSYLLAAKSAEGGIDTMAFGDAELKLAKDFEKFSFSISATGGGEPEFMSMQIKPRGHCNMHGEANCCFLVVDDIILAGSTTLTTPAPQEEEKSKRKKGKSDEESLEENEVDTIPVIRENKGEPQEQPIQPADEATDTEEETPAEEVPSPERSGATDPEEVSPGEAQPEETPIEEGSTEQPVEEGWESEEESSDDGLIR